MNLHHVFLNPAPGRFRASSAPGRRRHRVLAMSMALAWALPGWSQQALPQGAEVVSGSAKVTAVGHRMTVQQGSDKAILNWQSFGIAKDHQVTFQQPGAASVALNRVVGSDASAIHGTLNANGRVFLVNPNGVVFGPGASVNVGGIVASTLDISDANFLRGHYRFDGQGSGLQGAAVTNHGTITAAEHGAVALLGGTVSNQGTIAARLGAVALAAGNQVTLDFAGDGLLHVQVDQSAVNALAENQQLIQADGGHVLITAKATDALLQTVVNHTGTVQARTVGKREGKIVLLGGFNGGTTRVAGTLDASTGRIGNGGFVDTSGANVRIAPGTRVTTRAALGKTGTWLIDPIGLAVDAGDAPTGRSAIGAKTLNENLLTTNVVLATMAGDGAQGGHIDVNAPLAWSRNRLTFDARGSIHLNDVMSVSGTGTLALNHGATAGDAGKSPMAGTELKVDGRVDFAQAGAHLLTINGHGYTVINTLDALQAMGGALGGRYALGRSIDASTTAAWHDAAGFVPIGSAGAAFTGVFDGLGHTIRGLVINRPEQDHVGLFGFARNATLRNVGLVDASVRGRHQTGALVGTQYASGGAAHLFNVHASGKTWGGNFTGGLVGYQHANAGTATLSHAHALGRVTGLTRVGGLVGHHAVSGTAGSAAARISRAHASVDVSGQSGVGGLVGSVFAATGTASIAQAYATGAVSGGRVVGGLVGLNGEGGGISRVSEAYASGAVTGTKSVAGLVGMVFAGSRIGNAYWITQTSGQFSRGTGRGLGLGADQMFDAHSWAGFDFATVWGNAHQQTTPYLRGVAGNRVFHRNDLPSPGWIGVDNRPALHTVPLNAP